MRTQRILALAAAALLSLGSAQAKETVVWWDFLAGGDGLRMKALIDQFNKEHADSIEIQGTTLNWGLPFYTKLQTSAAIGEGPDVATYHLSRLPLGVVSGVLSPIAPADLAAAGISPSDYSPASIAAATFEGKQYAVPFDMHALVLYYNADMLSAAGLLGADGKPAGIDSIAGWEGALAKLTKGDGIYGLSTATADAGIDYRIVYSLFGQQGGVMLENGKFLQGDNLQKLETATAETAKWVANGWTPKQTDYPAALALFTTGKAAFHLNGNWEVPTLADLAAKGKLFKWGAIELPKLYAQQMSWADSHSFIIPNNVGKTPTPEKKAAVFAVIKWMNQHSLAWAGAGHIPAYNKVRESAEFKSMQPQASYAGLVTRAIYDPKSKLAGPASPLGDAWGNYIVPAVNGELTPADAATKMRDDLNGQ